MMRDSILGFFKQFKFEPKVENKGGLGRFDKFVVCGMGGSHLAADVLRDTDFKMDVIIHSDYGLPGGVGSDRLYIFSSYSGNTEEVLDGLGEALKRGYSVAVSAVGGRLLEIAKEKEISYVRMPDTGIQPRSALGYSFRAIARLMGRDDLLDESYELRTLEASEFEKIGRDLAQHLSGKVPVIYASRRNLSVAYNWKIKLNETSKVPAFYNVLPELNHNEMTGFDINDLTRRLSEGVHFVFLRDGDDHPRNVKRMNILTKLYGDRGLLVQVVKMGGKTRLEKIFSSLVIADWVALRTAEMYGLDPNEVPMVEEFKGLMRG